MLHLSFSLKYFLLCYYTNVMGDNKIGDDKNEGDLLAILIAMGMQRYDVRRIAWWSTSGMPPFSKCLRCVALVAAMVNKFVETTQNTNKTQLLASKYGTFWSLAVCENFIPQNESSTQLIDATSCVKIWNTTIGAEELVEIYSFQMLSGDKK